MPSIDLSKAAPAFQTYVDVIAARDNIGKVAAINKALASGTGKGLFDLARQHNLQKQLALQGVGKVDSSDGHYSRQESGQVQFPPAHNEDHSGGGQRSLQGAGHVETADEALARMRADHAARFVQRMQKVRAKHPDWPDEKVETHAKMGDLVGHAAFKVMQPLSNDGNAGVARGPHESFHAETPYRMQYGSMAGRVNQ